jgi:hypothetical protein
MKSSVEFDVSANIELQTLSTPQIAAVLNGMADLGMGEKTENIGDFQFRPPTDASGLVPDEVFFQHGEYFLHIERMSETEIWLGITNIQKKGMSFTFFTDPETGGLQLRAEPFGQPKIFDEPQTETLDRDAHIRKLHNEGYSLRAIGDIVGLSYERIRQILAIT